MKSVTAAWWNCWPLTSSAVRDVADGISMRQFAKLLGVSPAAVSKAAATGRISRLPNGKIDPDTAIAEWNAHTNPGSAKTGRNGNGADSASAREYQRARAVREHYQARLAELEFKRVAGELVPLDEVKKQGYETAKRARDLLETLPDRLAPVLIGVDDLDDMHAIIRKEVRKVCLELSKP